MPTTQLYSADQVLVSWGAIMMNEGGRGPDTFCKVERNEDSFKRKAGFCLRLQPVFEFSQLGDCGIPGELEFCHQGVAFRLVFSEMNRNTIPILKSRYCCLEVLGRAGR